MVDQINWNDKKKNWITSVQTVFNDVKKWCLEQRWEIDETEKVLTEDYVGAYAVPKLQVKTNKGVLFLEPVGMNIVGAQGRIDILSWPSLNRMLLILVDGKWSLNTESRVQWPQSWNKETFYKIADALTE